MIFTLQLKIIKCKLLIYQNLRARERLSLSEWSWFKHSTSIGLILRGCLSYLQKLTGIRCNKEGTEKYILAESSLWLANSTLQPSIIVQYYIHIYFCISAWQKSLFAEKRFVHIWQMKVISRYCLKSNDRIQSDRIPEPPADLSLSLVLT